MRFIPSVYISADTETSDSMVAVIQYSLLSGRYNATESGRENSWRTSSSLSSCSFWNDLALTDDCSAPELIIHDEAEEFMLNNKEGFK